MATEEYAEKAAAKRATRIEDGWEHLIYSPLPDFSVKV
jgi:hypothetical protein